MRQTHGAEVRLKVDFEALRGVTMGRLEVDLRARGGGAGLGVIVRDFLSRTTSCHTMPGYVLWPTKNKSHPKVAWRALWCAGGL